MTHLSEAMIYDYIDNRLQAASMRSAEEHCASCARCRRVVELHRALRRTASVPETGLLSEDFTERLLRRAHVPTPAPRRSWILQNIASMVAMAVVLGILGVVWYVAVTPAPDSGAADQSIYTQWYAMAGSAVSSTMTALTQHSTSVVTPVVTESGGVFSGVFWIGVAALVILGAIDLVRSRLKLITAR